MAKSVNVMDYIPSTYWSDIESYTYTTDLSTYAQAALDDAATITGGSPTQGGEVTFPAGGFWASGLIVYPQQYVHGAWQSTYIKQVDDKDVFISSDYFIDPPHAHTGRLWDKLAFTTDDSSLGGSAILDYGYKDQMSNIYSEGLPITLTGQNSIGVKKNTGNHVLTNIYTSISPRGSILTLGPVTDTFISYLTINNCGTIGGPAAIDIENSAGWEFHFAKIFSCPGKLLRTPSVWNLLITGGYFDYMGGDDCAIDLTASLSKDQGARLIGNQFRIVATAPPVSGSYNLVKFSGGHVHLTHVGNIYNVDTSIVGSNVSAITLSGSDYHGNSVANEYNGFNEIQRGNAEALLGPLTINPFDLRERIS